MLATVSHVLHMSVKVEVEIGQSEILIFCINIYSSREDFLIRLRKIS